MPPNGARFDKKNVGQPVFLLATDFHQFTSQCLLPCSGRSLSLRVRTVKIRLDRLGKSAGWHVWWECEGAGVTRGAAPIESQH